MSAVEASQSYVESYAKLKRDSGTREMLSRAASGSRALRFRCLCRDQYLAIARSLLQLLQVADTEPLVKLSDALTAQTRQPQQFSQSGLGVLLQLLRLRELAALDYLPNLASEVPAYPRQLGQVLVLLHHLRHASRVPTHGPSCFPVGPDPELVLALDLQQVRHLVENVCHLRVLDRHDYPSVIICCSLSASCTA